MSPLKTTLKAWPVVAAATIGLCLLTKTVAGLLGFDIPDQQNVDIVGKYLARAFDDVQSFKACALLLLQVLVIMPVVEEVYFRHFFYRQLQKPISKRGLAIALVPTASILVIGWMIGAQNANGIASKLPTSHPLMLFSAILFAIAVAEYVIRVFAGRLAAKTSPYLVIVISSALFSAAHYISQPFPDAAFIALFFFGLAQCWLYAKTDRLWCPMLNHFLFNLTNLVLLFVVTE